MATLSSTSHANKSGIPLETGLKHTLFVIDRFIVSNSAVGKSSVYMYYLLMYFYIEAFAICFQLLKYPRTIMSTYTLLPFCVLSRRKNNCRTKSEPTDWCAAKLQRMVDHYFFHRLPFGISSAPEHFQRRMFDILTDLPGVVCMMYDIQIRKMFCMTYVFTVQLL